jgi:hypothetical protein
MNLTLEEIIERVHQLNSDLDFYLERLKNTRLMSDISYYRLILGFINEERELLKDLAQKKFNYII